MPATKGQFICASCDREFDTNTGASVHSMSEHGVPRDFDIRKPVEELTKKLPEHDVPEYTQIIVKRSPVFGYDTEVHTWWGNEVEPWIQDCLHRASPVPPHNDLQVDRIVITHRDGGSETWLLTLDESR